MTFRGVQICFLALFLLLILAGWFTYYRHEARESAIQNFLQSKNEKVINVDVTEDLVYKVQSEQKSYEFEFKNNVVDVGEIKQVAETKSNVIYPLPQEKSQNGAKEG